MKNHQVILANPGPPDLPPPGRCQGLGASLLLVATNHPGVQLRSVDGGES